jgi:hypothetical protein
LKEASAFPVVSGESVSHVLGRRIVAILPSPPDALGDADLAHMRKTVGFVGLESPLAIACNRPL